ncbi:hypothetical protein [Dongia rigui]|uniref:Uncharacterized protein n=1 Tax=Dongia rigui TaxID=940149 RepID=A0ABU5E2I9_9PROT|nr:hypothetical protein [Dongia rigui]MDY0873108.1 hypothetical protein [Dongia rigui]
MTVPEHPAARALREAMAALRPTFGDVEHVALEAAADGSVAKCVLVLGCPGDVTPIEVQLPRIDMMQLIALLRPQEWNATFH